MASPPKNQQIDSKTVAYEFKMLCYTASRLPNVDPSTDWEMYNALVESFALHCRNLLDFFFGKGAPNEVSATDFDASWSEPYDAALFDLARRQASKHVAHILTERQDVNFPGGLRSEWNMPLLLPQFVALMDRFLGRTAGTLDPLAEQVLRNTVAQFMPRHAPPPSPRPGAPTPRTAASATITPHWMAAKTAPPNS